MRLAKGESSPVNTRLSLTNSTGMAFLVRPWTGERKSSRLRGRRALRRWDMVRESEVLP
jgi:hypothetical protein